MDVLGDGARDSVLERANGLLTAFGPRHLSLTLSGIVVRTGLPKSTAHRTAQQMLRLGWLSYESGRYSLGPRLFEISGLSTFRHELREAALPYMEDLYEATHATVHLGIRDGMEVLYVEKISGHAKVTEITRVGGRMPLHCTALGKAILAHSKHGLVDQVVAKGLRRYTGTTLTTAADLKKDLVRTVDLRASTDHQEATKGVCCVGAPIFGPDRSVVAAISVTGPVDWPGLDRLPPAVIKAAGGVARSLAEDRFAGKATVSRPAASPADQEVHARFIVAELAAAAPAR